jgi:hypothetical protein
MNEWNHDEMKSCLFQVGRFCYTVNFQKSKIKWQGRDAQLLRFFFFFCLVLFCFVFCFFIFISLEKGKQKYRSWWLTFKTRSSEPQTPLLYGERKKYQEVKDNFHRIVVSCIKYSFPVTSYLWKQKPQIHEGKYILSNLRVLFKESEVEEIRDTALYILPSTWGFSQSYCQSVFW